ncbi:hypothetical protein E4U43_006985 [Claviceps pusilla]|uniref:Uncharacterized protein n=1 Tax=Claviceps pusilla TaxID=123648 RepID=A0A9P7N0F6_9HYPO|nr:hypothetical protein E4U43_006985 [Claviceps pusilla]
MCACEQRRLGLCIIHAVAEYDVGRGRQFGTVGSALLPNSVLLVPVGSRRTGRRAGRAVRTGGLGVFASGMDSCPRRVNLS